MTSKSADGAGESKAGISAISPGGLAANPRVQKSVYWLELARRDGQNITIVVTLAVTRAGYTNATDRKLLSGRSAVH